MDNLKVLAEQAHPFCLFTNTGHRRACFKLANNKDADSNWGIAQAFQLTVGRSPKVAPLLAKEINQKGRIKKTHSRGARARCLRLFLTWRSI